jgi:hypothetical protein
VYVADLEVAANAICRSHDHGKTFDANCETGTASNQQGPESDREWINADPRDPKVLYFTYHDISAQFPLIYRSTDGGSSFSPCGMLYQPGSDAFMNFGPGGTDVGKPVVTRTGAIYVPITEPDAAGNPMSPYDHFDIAVSKDGCSGQTQFTDHVIYTAPGASLANIFSGIAVDGSGTLYAVAAGTLNADQKTYGLYLWVSHDQGTTWSKPIQVNPPELTANVLPAVAGGRGRDQVAIGWYGTSTSGDPNDTKDEWRYYVAASTDGGATFQRATVTPTPFHYGDVCTTGILCTTGNRNLLDFSSIAVDPADGSIMPVFPGDPFDTPANGKTDQAAAYVARQAGGPRLTASGSTSITTGAGSGAGSRGPTACAATAGFASVSATPRGGSVGLGFSRRRADPVDVDVFQTSRGRQVLGQRLVARFDGRTTGVTWNGQATQRGRRVTDGYYFVRYRMRLGGGRFDVRRIVLRRSRGRWSRRPDFYRRASCGTLESFKLERPVFGGTRNRALNIAYRLGAAARVTVIVRRGGRLVQRWSAGPGRAHRTYRLRLASERLPTGDYRVTLTAVRRGHAPLSATLVSRRL